jgi:hypothetical protein
LAAEFVFSFEPPFVFEFAVLFEFVPAPELSFPAGGLGQPPRIKATTRTSESKYVI